MRSEIRIERLPHRYLIEEGRDPNAGELLLPEESAIAARLRNSERSAEWTAARSVAKRLAVLSGLADKPTEVSIPTIAERPRLRIRGIESKQHISISHSGRLFGAILADHPVGLDIQKPRPIRDGALHFFLSEEEIAELDRLSSHDARLHFWVAKEAAFKCDLDSPTYKSLTLEVSEQTKGGAVFNYRGQGMSGSVETIRLGNETVIGWTIQ